MGLMLLGSAIGDGSFWHFWATGGDGSVLYDWKIIAGCVGSLLSFLLMLLVLGRTRIITVTVGILNLAILAMRY